MTDERLAEFERTVRQQRQLYVGQATELLAEVRRLRSFVRDVATWPDAGMETARTLHYDWRGQARRLLSGEEQR